jgi:hypothetical protein
VKEGPDQVQADTADARSDAELVRQAKSASGQAAVAALYRRYLTPVYRYFCARTGDAGLAEDLTSQTFVAVLEGLPRYRVELDGVLSAVEGPWELAWDWRGQ